MVSPKYFVKKPLAFVPQHIVGEEILNIIPVSKEERLLNHLGECHYLYTFVYNKNIVKQNIEALIYGLVGSGNHPAFLSGSRNALVLAALSEMKNIRCESVVDERSAAFKALGAAKATSKTAILSCTSGTAALNYYPAMAEAFYARVPLIVLTADRPPNRDQWDGQAIRQENVFANHVRGSTPQKI
jgi:2-succinyl-5-enolpyruvyl-6-hydroxy-3-cyclohexene-1-carboxylate synthase